MNEPIRRQINEDINEHINERVSEQMTEQMVEKLLKWYPEHKRDLPWRQTKNPYCVWLSEIMLQQTRVEAVKGYYARFLAELEDVHALAHADDDLLMKLWEGLGYYSRVRNLKKAAIMIEQQHEGNFPMEYDKIRGLAGIGDYTAGAIGSICFNLPTPAVDGNVLRVYTRVMADDANIDKQSTKRRIRNELEVAYRKAEADGMCGMATQSLMELGATVCVPNGIPKCAECPLNDICKAYQCGNYSEYPVRNKKKERKICEKTVFLLEHEGFYAVRKRVEPGLLHGMWEFVNTEGNLTEQQASAWLLERDLQPTEILMKKTYTHIFSHVEWHMVAYYFKCNNKKEDYRWATIEEMEQTIAIPSAFAPFKPE